MAKRKQQPLPSAKGKLKTKGKQLNAPVVDAPVVKAKVIVRKRHEKRDLAKALFVRADVTAKEISKRLGVNEKTLGAWRKEDSWDDEKTLLNVSPVSLIKWFNSSIEKIRNKCDEEERQPNTKEADAIAKLSKSIKDLRGNISPQVILEVLYGFVFGYLDKVKPELADQIANESFEYVQSKFRENKEGA